MSSLEQSFKQWMQQAGIIKQLQLALTISIIIIALLSQQLISNNISKDLSTKKKPSATKITKEASKPVTEQELNNVVTEYLNNFFSTNAEAIEYLKTHTDTELFMHSIEPEIRKRIELNLASQFEINDLYLESINSNQVKAICLGQENFPNGDYQSRNCTIEILIDTSSLKVVAIPVFQIK